MTLSSIVDAPTNYESFLATKQRRAPATGFSVAREDLPTALFDYQSEITAWALKRGCAAVFAERGLGKTVMQLAWANAVHHHTGRDALILAPLAVAPQTYAEAQEKLGLHITIARSQANVQPGITIANYEMLEHFDAGHFGGIVLDESSILKAFSGKTKQALIAAFAETPYRLCCTATPAPNDPMEIGNHAEFLGIMPSSEMLMRWFINDTMQSGHYRLKGHAEADFWAWVASWAVAIEKPSDLGYSDDGFILPPLTIHHDIVEVDRIANRGDQLFRAPVLNATTTHREMRLTAAARAERAAAIVNASPETWVVWCQTNYEADELKKRIPDAIEVRGSETPLAKERKLTQFSRGEARVIITKPEIAGYGLNWQHCHEAIYMGSLYSFEDFYQAVGRQHRFRQEHAVNMHVILAETEMDMLATLDRKMEQHLTMRRAMVAAVSARTMREDLALQHRTDFTHHEGDDWNLYHGDCVAVTRTLPDASVHFSIFSPPFSSLYTYSDNIQDLGNSANDDEFFAHFDYLIPELHRVTVPGRLCAVHCKQLPNYKGRDGMAGLRDFRGEIIRHFIAAGWSYHSEVVIWKDPVIEMQRTKAHGLLYKQLRADSSFSRQGMAEYLVVFRRWPKNQDEESLIQPVTHTGTGDDFPVDANGSPVMWQRYASPVWMDIRQTRVLNADVARESQDEKHICPLQLDVIERALDLWTNPGDVVYSPFAGIGSEGVVSLEKRRKFVGAELKDSYVRQAVRFLDEAIAKRRQPTLFDDMEVA
jgi:DNA modification methylase/superfamily II DNA or RNA helicase